ncbi:MAG: hypothetical protein HQK50_16410, partial [Oligoflexia bacterium]|nr:hypothetical protein [Oligoflexia bacterium]
IRYSGTDTKYKKDTAMGEGLAWKKVTGSKKWIAPVELDKSVAKKSRDSVHDTQGKANLEQEKFIEVGGKKYLAPEAPFQKDTSTGEGLAWEKKQKGKWETKSTLPQTAADKEQEIRYSGTDTKYKKDTAMGEGFAWKKINAHWGLKE